MASPEREIYLKQEYGAYCKASITSCPYIRAMYDIAGQSKDSDSTSYNTPCLALEWMDCTPNDVPEHRRKNAAFHWTYWEGGLLSSTAIARADMVNMGKLSRPLAAASLRNLDNKNDGMLVSNLDINPVVKLGVLG